MKAVELKALVVGQRFSAPPFSLPQPSPLD